MDLERFLPPDSSMLRSLRTSQLQLKSASMALDRKGGWPVPHLLGEIERPSYMSTFQLSVRSLSFDSSDQPWPNTAPHRLGEASSRRDRLMANAQRRPPKLSRCVERN
jgi:hypothetical protein